MGARYSGTLRDKIAVEQRFILLPLRTKYNKQGVAMAFDRQQSENWVASESLNDGNHTVPTVVEMLIYHQLAVCERVGATPILSRSRMLALTHLTLDSNDR